MVTAMGISSFNVVKQVKDRFYKGVYVMERHLTGIKQLVTNEDRLVPLLSELRWKKWKMSLYTEGWIISLVEQTIFHSLNHRCCNRWQLWNFKIKKHLPCALFLLSQMFYILKHVLINLLWKHCRYFWNLSFHRVGFFKNLKEGKSRRYNKE